MAIHTFADAAIVRAALCGEESAEDGLEALARIEGHIDACAAIELERVREIKRLKARVKDLEAEAPSSKTLILLERLEALIRDNPSYQVKISRPGDPAIADFVQTVAPLREG